MFSVASNDRFHLRLGAAEKLHGSGDIRGDPSRRERIRVELSERISAGEDNLVTKGTASGCKKNICPENKL